MSEQPITRSTAAHGEYVVHVECDFEPLVPTFLANRKKEVMAMREALARNDFETTGGIAHGMKGAGSIYGFERITVLATAIERAAQTRSVTSIETNLTLLATYLERVQIVFT